jgi:peptidoglycan/xylan/chitin deacetylase (PgdA/CDA1 family)
VIVPEKTTYNSCNVEGMSIAITFDDGPNAELTPKLLDMLKERGIKATFFVVGKNVEEYPGIVARMATEGHEVANHSWSHPALTKLGVESFRKQIENTNEAIAKATGKRPVLMRPPYGATSVSLNKRLNEQFGLKVILWSVDPLDWKYRNSNRVYNAIIQNTRPGSIILAHDIHATTVAAMPATLDALLAKGYKFATVSELIAMEIPPQLAKKDPAAATRPRNRVVAAASTPPEAPSAMRTSSL